jgi:hypothetical protein
VDVEELTLVFKEIDTQIMKMMVIEEEIGRGEWGKG